MSIELDSEELRTLVAKAVLDSMTPEKREAILIDAVAKLIQPAPPAYGRGPAVSPMETALQEAVHKITREIATERVNNDAALKTQIDGLFQGLVLRLFASPLREQMIDRMADAVVSGLRAS